MDAGAIARQFPVSRPAISRHLRLLRRAALVREHRVGRRRVYHVDPAPLQTIDQWLDRYRIFWSARLVALKEIVEAQHEGKGDRENAAARRPDANGNPRKDSEQQS